jgi:magnesium-transporting ATPase (P-type)
MVDHPHKGSHYLTFAAMIATSMVAMYVLTYVNTLELAHVRWSETRFYMTFVMGAAMAVIMLTFMRGMYRNAKANLGIYVGSLVIFVAALFLVRSQITVQDASYMRAMIPHHSIAILTSDRAGITDVRVRELAEGIIEAQRREIKEMDWLLADIRDNGKATTQAEADARPVPDFSAAP